MTTYDGKKFWWRFNKETKGKKELWIEAKQERRIEIFKKFEALKGLASTTPFIVLELGESVQGLKDELDQLTNELRKLSASREQLKLPPTTEELVRKFAEMLRRESKDRT